MHKKKNRKTEKCKQVKNKKVQFLIDITRITKWILDGISKRMGDYIPLGDFSEF